MNKKLIVLSSLAITALMFASPVYAQSVDVTKIQTFIKSIIQILVTIAGLVSAGSSSGEDSAISLVQETLKNVRSFQENNFVLGNRPCSCLGSLCTDQYRI